MTINASKKLKKIHHSFLKRGWLPFFAALFILAGLILPASNQDPIIHAQDTQLTSPQSSTTTATDSEPDNNTATPAPTTTPAPATTETAPSAPAETPAVTPETAPTTPATVPEVPKTKRCRPIVTQPAPTATPAPATIGTAPSAPAETPAVTPENTETPAVTPENPTTPEVPAVTPETPTTTPAPTTTETAPSAPAETPTTTPPAPEAVPETAPVPAETPAPSTTPAVPPALPAEVTVGIDEPCPAGMEEVPPAETTVTPPAEGAPEAETKEAPAKQESEVTTPAAQTAVDGEADEKTSEECTSAQLNTQESKPLIEGSLVTKEISADENPEADKIKLAEVDVPGKQPGDKLTPDEALMTLVSLTTSEKDIEEAVIESVLKRNESDVTQFVLQDQNSQDILRQKAQKGFFQSLQSKVEQTIDSPDVRQQLAKHLEHNAEVENILNVIDTDELKNELIKFSTENSLRAPEEKVTLEEGIWGLIKDNYNTLTLENILDEKLISDPSAQSILADAVAQDTTPSQAEQQTRPMIRVVAYGPNGDSTVIPFENLRFEAGSIILGVSPLRQFAPGVYKVQMEMDNPITGVTATVIQNFAWGVLTLNTDRDIYQVGGQASLNMGVLDDSGKPVCNADITLSVEPPSGSTSTLNVTNTGACGTYNSINVVPDYLASYTFSDAGIYNFKLTATLTNGVVRTMTRSVTVTTSPDYIIERTAATRLYPVGKTPMNLNIYFFKDFDGYISDVAPHSFAISGIESAGNAVTSKGDLASSDDGKSWLINWHVTAVAGNTVSLRYFFDAPDISPQFYTVGPLNSSGDLLEKRQWQIAIDQPLIKSDLTNELLGYWKFDDGSGNTVADSSPYSVTGTLYKMKAKDWSTNVPTSLSDDPYSLRMNGVNAYISVSNPADAHLDFGDGSGFTITGWFDTTAKDKEQAIIAKKNSSKDKDPGYMIYLSADNHLVLTVSDGKNSYSLISSSTFTPNKWYHFAAIWDPVNVADSVIYVNGTKNLQTRSGTIEKVGDLTNDLDFNIGATSEKKSPFAGYLDEIKVYNRDLTAQEVAVLVRGSVTLIDNSPPILNSIVIDGGIACDNRKIFKLTLSSTDNISGLGQMQFSCDNSNWTDPEPFSDSKSFDMTKESSVGCTDVNGDKTIYAKFSDRVGNWSDAVSATVKYHSFDLTCGIKPDKKEKHEQRNWEKDGYFAKFKPEQEIVGKRDATSKTFANPDGSLTSVLIGGPIHYKKNGEWKEIQTDVLPNTSGENTDYPYATVETNNARFYPAKSGQKGAVMDFNGEAYKDWINPEMRWLDADGNTLQSTSGAQTSAKVNQNTITYPSVYKNTDVNFVQENVSRKADIILSSPSALDGMPSGATQLAYCEQVNIPQDWTYETQTDPNDPTNITGVIFSDGSGKQTAGYPTPYIYEQTNEANQTYAKFTLEEQEDSLEVCTVVPVNWLTAPQRQFPVVLDPYLYAYTTANSVPETGTVSSAGDKWTNGDADIGCWGSCSPTRRAWARFDASSIMDGSTFTAATLYTWLRQAPTVGSQNYYAYVGTYDATTATGAQIYGDTGYYSGGSDTVLTTDAVNHQLTQTFSSSGYGYLTSRLSNNWFSMVLLSTTLTDYFRIDRYDSSYYPELYVTYTTPTLTLDISTAYTSTYNYIGYQQNITVTGSQNIGSGTCTAEWNSGTTHTGFEYPVSSLGIDCAGTLLTQGGTDGPNYVCLYAVDANGIVANYPCHFIIYDSTVPNSGNVTYSGGYYTSLSTVTMSESDGSDPSAGGYAGSGINTSSRLLYRASAALSNGSCGTYSGYSATTQSGTYPNIKDGTGVSDNTCYKYEWLVSDNVGNQATYTNANEVKYDTTAPVVNTFTAQNGFSSSTGPSISWNVTDPGSGIATSSPDAKPFFLYYATAPLSSTDGVATGTCGGYGSYGQQYNDYPQSAVLSEPSNYCYEYYLLSYNRAALYTSYYATPITKVDSSYPSAPSSISYTDGYNTTTNQIIYWNPGLDMQSGISYWDVWYQTATLSSSDGKAAPTCGSYGSLSSWGGVGAGSGTGQRSVTDSSLSSGLCYKFTIGAVNNVSLEAQATVPSYVTKDDQSAPAAATSLSYVNGWSTSTSNTVTWTASTGDSQSGLASEKLQQATATANTGDGICGTFSGFSDTGYTTSPATLTLSDNTCYQFRILDTNYAGLTNTATSANVLKIDTTAGTSSPSFSSSYYGPNTYQHGGTYSTSTIHGSAADTTSGIASVTFYLKRSTDSYYWNNSTWVSSAVLSTTLSLPPYTWYPTTAIDDSTAGFTNGTIYTVNTYNSNGAGLGSSWLTPQTFTWDSAGPTGSISNGSGNPTNNTTPTLNLTIADSGVGTSGAQMRFSCDNATWNSWAAYATPVTTFNIKPGVSTYGCGTTDGTRTVYVQFEDSLQNIGSSYNTGSFTLDTTPPVISSTAPTTGSYVNYQTVNYTLSEGVASGSIVYTRTSGVADSNSPHTCTLQGGALTSGSHNSFALSQGANNCTTLWNILVSGTVYTIAFNATDAAGNPATQVSNTSVMYDTDNPTIGTPTIYSGTSYSNYWYKGAISIRGALSDNSGAFTASSCYKTLNNGSSYDQTTVSQDASYCYYGSVSPGANFTLGFRVQDAAGNTGYNAGYQQYIYDATPPSGGSATYTNGYQTTTPISVTVSAGSDALSGMSTTNSDYYLEVKSAPLSGGLCQTDTGWADSGVSETYNATSYSYTGASGYCYQFRYSVKDNLGNSVTYTGTDTTKIDANAPTISADNSSSSWVATNPTITITSSDTGGSGLSYSKYSWDTSDATCRSSGTTVSGTINIPSEGAHTLYLCNADAAGNTGSWNGPYKLDTSVPTISSITSVAGDSSAPYYDTTDNSSTSIIFVSSDTYSGVSACKWDSTDTGYTAMANTCASATNCVANLSGQGSKTVYIRCIDAAGNPMTSSQSVTYTIDSIAPTITSTAPATGAYINTQQVSYTFSETTGTGQIVFTRSSGSADSNSPHTCTLQGTALASGSHSFQLQQGSNFCSQAWNSLVSGTLYTVTFNATDLAGNPASTVTNTSVTFDTTAPTLGAPAIYSGTNYNNYFNGTISVRSAISDTGGSGLNSSSCQVSINSGAYTATGVTQDANYCYYNSYNPGANFTIAFYVEDNAGNNNVSSTQSMFYDATGPTGLSISPLSTRIISASVYPSFTVSDGTDSGSGIDTSTRQLQRATASYSANTCGSFGGYSNVSPLSGTYPNVSDNTASGSNCYQYRWEVADHVGNLSFTSPTSTIVRVPFTTITKTAGDSQNSGSGSNPIGITLPTALQVRVTDGGTNWALSGEVTVNFSISSVPGSPTATGQSLGTPSPTTDSSGYASSTLTLGDRAGTYQVQANATGTNTVTFNETEDNYFSLDVTEPTLSFTLNPSTFPTGSASPTVNVATNAASYSIQLTPNQWPTYSSYQLSNWASSLGFGWNFNNGTVTSYNTSGSNPAATTVYSCSGDTCQGSYTVNIKIYGAVNYLTPAYTYSNSVTFGGTSISY